jgi:hypothetical protein
MVDLLDRLDFGQHDVAQAMTSHAHHRVDIVRECRVIGRVYAHGHPRPWSAGERKICHQSSLLGLKAGFGTVL